MRTFNPYFKTYKALGTLTGTTAEIYATVQAVLDSIATRELFWNTPKSVTQIINAGDKCIAISFSDFFEDDRQISFPLINKYGFQASAKIPCRPLNHDYRNSNFWTRKEVRHIEMAGCYIADHGFQHFVHMLSCPLYDGRTTPSNDDLRIDAGDGKNAWNNTIIDTVNTSLTEAIAQSYLALGDTIGATAWEDLTDANCDTIRKSMSAFGRPHYGDNHILQALDYLSERYCGTSGLSIYDNYTTRTPNTADGLEPSVINPIIGGIFQGAATTQNQEIWDRMLIIIREYKK